MVTYYPVYLTQSTFVLPKYVAYIVDGVLDTSRSLSYINVENSICGSNFKSVDGMLFGGDTLVYYPYLYDATEFVIKDGMKIVESSISVASLRNGKYLQSITVEQEDSNLFSVDGILYEYDSKNNIVALILYPPAHTATEFELPDLTAGYESAAMRIGKYAFSNNPYLQKVTFSNTKGWIGVSAFTNLPSLKIIDIGKADTDISTDIYGTYSMFSGCNSLTDIYLYDDEQLNIMSTYPLYMHLNLHYMSTQTVTFLDADGKEYYSVSVIHGEDAIPPEPPVKAGYTFVAWDKDYTAVKTALVLKPIFEQEIVEIGIVFMDEGFELAHFNMQAGERPEEVNVIPEDREGYIFLVWAESPVKKNLKGVRSEQQEYFTDIVYYAQWAVDESAMHTVTFKDGITGEQIGTTLVVDGNYLTQYPEAALHVGYEFTGWNFYGAVTEDITVTSEYSKLDGTWYKVTFKDSIDDTVISIIQVKSGEKAEYPNAPSHSGWKFTSWSNTGEITTDTVITAQYERLGYMTFNVKFIDSITGSIIATDDICENTVITEFPEALKHYGYKFTGWSYDNSPVTQNITVYAQYVETEITLDDALNAEGGILHFTTSSEYPWITSEANDMCYAFSGNTGSGESVSSVSTTVKLVAGQTFSFNYKMSTGESDFFTVTANGATISKINGEKGWTKATMMAYTDSTIEFTWTYTKNSSKGSGSDCVWLDEVTVGAEPTVFHEVTFADGLTGETISQATFPDGVPVQIFPTAPEHDGYTFYGWSHKKGTVVKSDLTIFAVYEQTGKTNYTVTYLDWDGTVLSMQRVAAGEDAKAPTDPVRDGYTFKGWDSDGKNITADITITAQYEEEQGFTLGDVNDDGKINTRDAVLVLQYFAGWDVVINMNAADIDGNGKINTRDAVLILRFFAGYTDTPLS